MRSLGQDLAKLQCSPHRVALSVGWGLYLREEGRYGEGR
jgi:hypothetical protein